MSSRTKKYMTTRSLLTSWLALLAAVSLVVAMGTACQQEVVVGGGNQGGDNSETTNKDNQNQNQGEDHPYDDEYFEHHGPDDDQELTDAGSLQGSWRAAFVEGDTPLAYFDIFHDDGESSADGDFLAGPAISDMQDGTTGAIADVTISGAAVVVKWNPTTDDEELYTLELEAQGDDSYSGEFSAQRYPNTHEVSFSRRQVEQ